MAHMAVINAAIMRDGAIKAKINAGRLFRVYVTWNRPIFTIIPAWKAIAGFPSLLLLTGATSRTLRQPLQARQLFRSKQIQVPGLTQPH